MDNIDFDSDSNLDLPVTTNAAIDVFIGDGLGSFALPTTYAGGVGDINGIATSDVDNDGKLDLTMGILCQMP